MISRMKVLNKMLFAHTDNFKYSWSDTLLDINTWSTVRLTMAEAIIPVHREEARVFTPHIITKNRVET